jgi:hypothetical protein
MMRCAQIWPRLSAWRLLLIVAVSILPSMAMAQVDYSAGKTPEQLFNSDCSACHASPQAVGRNRDARALTVFLGQHYTTKTQWAALIANYLIRVRDLPPSQPTQEAPTNKSNEREAKPAAHETLSGKLRNYATVGEEAKPPAPNN